MWQVIGSIVGFLFLIYLWIGAFRLADNWDTLKEWHAIADTKLSLWLVALLCLFCWPTTDYENARAEVKKANDGKKAQESKLATDASRGSSSSIHQPSSGSRLYYERSLELPRERREERVASFYDPYEHAQFYESDPLALSELVGGDDSDRDRRWVEEESRNAEGYVPTHGWETYSPPSSVETSTAPPSYEPCRESSSSDSGVGSDSSWSSGSDSCSSSNDSGGGSCGGE